MRKRFSVIVMVVVAMMLVVPSVLAASITVTQNNVGDDWLENVADGGEVTFTDEFGAPPGFGTGALKLQTGLTNSSRAQLNSTQDAGMLLDDIKDVSYWTYKSSDSAIGSDAQGPSINIAILADGVGSFTTLVFEPIYTPGNGGNSAYGLSEWKFWDASGEALWWSTQSVPGVCGINILPVNCGGDPYYAKFDDIKTANPDAVILGYAMNLGTWNPYIIAAVDGFTVGEKTFDFEPYVASPQPTSRDDCMKGGWADFGFKNQGLCIQFVNTGKDSR